MSILTRQEHIKRLERSMQKWRDSGMDKDWIFAEDYEMYMKKLEALKNGTKFIVKTYSPELAIAKIGAEICNLQRIEAGASPKVLSIEKLQKCIDTVNGLN